MSIRVTIKDVAKEAGVSTSTVSRVLTPQANNYMRKETREKVLRAIEELDYRPDARAQSLRGIGTRIIGLVMPDTLNPFYQELTYVLEEVCYRERYGLLVCSSKNSITRELAYIDLLERQKVDGIILSTVGLKKAKLNSLIKRGIPIVLVDRDVVGANIPVMFTNNYLGGCQATQYLIDLGHKKIACIAGAMNTLSSINRLKGYYDTLEKNGLEVDKKLFKGGKLTYKDGYKFMKELLRKSSDEFTAVFCLNDLVALGAMRAIQEDRKNMPSDYSIIGFDNISLSSISNPPLTTIAQPIKEIAQQAFKAIKRAKKRRFLDKKDHRFWDTKLIVRESCTKIS